MARKCLQRFISKNRGRKSVKNSRRTRIWQERRFASLTLVNLLKIRRNFDKTEVTNDLICKCCKSINKFEARNKTYFEISYIFILQRCFEFFSQSLCAISREKVNSGGPMWFLSNLQFFFSRTNMDFWARWNQGFSQFSQK